MLHPPLRQDAPQIASLAARAQDRGLVRVIARIARPAGAALVGTLSDAEMTTAQANFRSRAIALGARIAETIARNAVA